MAVEHRSVEAAKAAAAALARDLKSDVTAAGDAAARGLEEFLAARPPFQPLPRIAALVAEAYLFDSSSTLLSPDDDARARQGVEEHRLAAADPTWRRLIDRVHDLERTVLSLLGNAVKYSGRVRQISVAVGRRNGRAEISVADNGIGVPRAEQARIFDAFYRSAAAAGQTGGAGLALLARHFADAHGGRLAVHSQPGRGSVFSLSLPLCDRGSGAAASATDHGADSDR